MATGESDSMSDEVKEIKCFLCTDQKNPRDAQKYCMECKNYYCLSCVEIHKKIPVMKGHKISDLPSNLTQRCDQHPLEVVTKYCYTHDDVACGSCVNLSHKYCWNIISIAEKIDMLYPKDRYTRNKLIDSKEKLSQMKTILEHLKITKLSKQDKMEQLKENFNKEIESVKSFKQELQALLDEMEEVTIRRLISEYNRIIEESLAVEKEVDSLLSSLNEASSLLKTAEGNEAHEFICIKSSQKLINKAEKIKRLMEHDETIVFTPAWSIKAFMKKIAALDGEVPARDSTYNIKSRKTIDVKLKNDEEICFITGICLTVDFILLPDHNNRKLKRLYIYSGEVKDYIDFHSEPWAVCTVSMNEAAVTLHSKSVQFVSLGDKTRIITESD